MDTIQLESQLRGMTLDDIPICDYCSCAIFIPGRSFYCKKHNRVETGNTFSCDELELSNRIKDCPRLKCHLCKHHRIKRLDDSDFMTIDCNHGIEARLCNGENFEMR